MSELEHGEYPIGSEVRLKINKLKEFLIYSEELGSGDPDPDPADYVVEVSGYLDKNLLVTLKKKRNLAVLGTKLSIVLKRNIIIDPNNDLVK